MLVTKKMLLALTLVGALVGTGIGALATRTTQSFVCSRSDNVKTVVERVLCRAAGDESSNMSHISH